MSQLIDRELMILRNMLILFGICISCLACGSSSVKSSELASTKAEDLKIIAIIEESPDSNDVPVMVQLETIKSDIRIKFDNGKFL